LKLRYAIATAETAFHGAANCGRLRAPAELLRGSGLALFDFRAALARATDRWQRVAGLTFVEVPFGSAAEILVGEQVEPTGFAYTSLALSEPQGDTARTISAAAICLNPLRKWKIGFDGNLAVYDLEHTLAHELGYAIGLDHPSSRGHLMSFRYSESIASLTAGDALGAASIYGPATELPDTRRELVVTTTPSASIVDRGMAGTGTR
jgi:hypothetical protein